jgi:hypothetical protein
MLDSPHLLHYLIAYGLLLPFAWVGARRLMRIDAWTGWLLVGWVIVFPILVYMPISVQRRLAEGIFVVLVVMTLAALESIQNKGEVSEQISRSRSWAWLPLIFIFPSTLLLLAGGFLTVSQAATPVYRPLDEVAVFEYLRANAETGSVVITAYETGNPLPAWAPVRVVIGHGPESAKLKELAPRVATFFMTTTTHEARIAMIQEFNVRYVFWGPVERALGDWDPNQAIYLRQVEQTGDYMLFEVQQNFP